MRNKIIFTGIFLVFTTISIFSQNNGTYLKQRINGKIHFVNVNNSKDILMVYCSPAKIDNKIKGQVYPTILNPGDLINIEYQEDVLMYRLISIDGKLLNESKQIEKKHFDIKAPSNYKGVVILQIYTKNSIIDSHKLILL